MKTFRNKVAAITGAGSGMGRALAIELARRGCHVALSDIDETTLAETVALIDSPVTVTHQTVDVADYDAVKAWADQIVADHGRVNLIFNNAGVAAAASAATHDPKDMKWVMDINFGGVVNGTRAFLPYLERAGEGHIVNTSSVFGLIAIPTMSLYNASKFAVRGYTEALQQELRLEGSPVQATVVLPGGVKTNIAQASRLDPTLLGRYVNDRQEGVAEFEKMFFLPPSEAANQILRGVQKNRKRVLVGNDAVLVDVFQRLFPTAYQRLTRWFVAKRMGKGLVTETRRATASPS